MKLICTIGSLSCDGVIVERGDSFEMPDGVAKGLIEAGFTREDVPTKSEVPDMPQPVKSEVPDDTWTIAELKDRLDQMNVDYPARGTKAELLEIVNGGSHQDDITQESPNQ